MCETPTLCFDGDKAGRKAAYRAIETALPLIGPGKSLRFALLPDGQDPDDLAKTGGAEAIAAALAEALPFAEMLFLRETDEQDFDTPEARAALERRLRESVGAIGDETLRRHYAQDMTQRLAANVRRAGAAAGISARRRAPAPGGAAASIPGRAWASPIRRCRRCAAPSAAMSRSARFSSSRG